MFEGESASVEVTADLKDRRALSSARGSSTALGSRTPLLIATVIFAVTITFGRDILYNSFSVPFGIAATAASIAGLLFFLIVLNIFGRRRVARETAPQGALLQDYKLTASPDGLHLLNDNLNSHYHWAGVLSLNETESHLFLYTDGAQAIIVPKRCFDSPQDASRFAIIVRSHTGSGA
ncbi:MAG: YcxB family protein [Alphaproteobacteria bacterium]|jgi:hypothetical protein